jgi:uncharacterized protein involved in type VI secretion and phage assembly
MNLLVKAKITISETSSGELEIINFQSLVVRQQVFGLNSYDLQVDESIIEGDHPNFMQKASKLIGKKTTIKITTPEENDKLIFKGIVTNVSCHSSSESTFISIKAESPEVLMSYGVKKKVFDDLSIKDIASQIFSTYPASYIDSTVNADGLASSLKTTIMQYGETDYQFLRRLSSITGSWFFNDGVKTYFGKAPNGSSQDLLSGGSLSYFEVNTKVGATKHEADAYTPSKDEALSSRSATVSNTDSLTSTIVDETQKTFSNKNTYHAPSYLNTADLLNKYVEVKTKQDVAEVNTVSGSSCEPKLVVGGKVKIKRPDGNTQAVVGEYRITSLEIAISAEGNYNNHFSGIAYSDVAPRNLSYQPNIPSEMRGRVIDVNDPDGHGKVKVRLDWQDDGEDYGWLQVSSPSSGNDSGVYFRPEVDTWVIVSLSNSVGLDGSYVAGSLHHSNAQPKRWKHRENHIKGIKTPEGNELLFEDKGNDGRAISLQTKDDDGNYLWIADKNGTTEIYVRSKGIKLMAENDLEISAGGKLILQGTDVKISSGSTSVSKDSASQGSAMAFIELKSSGDVKVDSKSKVEVNAMMDVKISANANFTVSANMSAEVSGSASSTLKSSGVLTIQGTLVKIN